MKDELMSTEQNNVWELADLPKGYKRIKCKWVLKSKRNSISNIKKYKARLGAKSYTQKNGIQGWTLG